MGKMSVIFLAIIIVYLVYAFMQSRKGKEKNQNFVKKDEKFSTSTVSVLEEKPSSDYEAAAVAAVIAAIMGDAAYRIKRVYVTASVDEKKSSWKLSGRNESMMRRVFFK